MPMWPPRSIWPRRSTCCQITPPPSPTPLRRLRSPRPTEVGRHSDLRGSTDHAERRPIMGATKYRPLTREELNQLAGEELPERAAMSLVNANLAIPINAAIAANVLSDGAVAYGDAAQSTPITQTS